MDKPKVSTKHWKNTSKSIATKQDNWSKLLPLTKFAYNNALNATTGISPFFMNKGYHLNISVHSE